jgi:threonine/homoserine/homoserine lactone efflux protein
MVDNTRLAFFVSAALILALMPGPGILYVLGRTLNDGRREGMLSALGTFAGGFVHALAAALGLSAVLLASAWAFQAVRYAGAAYLIYLGITIIRTRHLDEAFRGSPAPMRRPLLQGIVTEVLNPKTALFFVSFIPQFVALDKGHAVWQSLMLGAISVCLNTGVDVIVVLFAAAVAKHLGRSKTLHAKQRTLSGVGMIGRAFM